MKDQNALSMFLLQSSDTTQTFRQLLRQARSLSEHRQSHVGTHMTFNTRRLPNFNVLISESRVVETFTRSTHWEMSKTNRHGQRPGCHCRYTSFYSSFQLTNTSNF